MLVLQDTHSGIFDNDMLALWSETVMLYEQFKYRPALHEDSYEDINKELQALAREADTTPAPLYVGSGEDAGILFFTWERSEHA